MPQGVCRNFSNQKGFGFITPDDNSKDLFVHQSDILSDGFRFLAEGQRVSFEVENKNPKGPRAVRVQKIAPILKRDHDRRESSHGHRPHA